MRNWDDLITIQSEKIHEQSIDGLAVVLKRNRAVSERLGETIELMLNNLSVPELRDGVTYHVVRTDPVQREWEATFSAINMIGPAVVSLACQGFYVPAICLLRQEFEGIAQLTHVLEGTRTTKKAPNIRHVEEKMRQWYPALSEGAHLSSDFVTSMQAPLFGDSNNLALLPHGSSIFPVFNKQLAVEIMEIHITIREELIKRVDEHLERNDIKRDSKASPPSN
jgi:hypothetical protein